MHSRRGGFTLLEICLALLIGLLLITLSVPSIGGMLREQRLKRSFEAFDTLVRSAKMKSTSERRTYAMAWDKDGITLSPVDSRPSGDDADASDERFVFEKGETFAISRPSSLVKKPAAAWVFWRTGTCEPALISFAGEAGKWTVQYDALTVRATFVDSEVR